MVVCFSQKCSANATDKLIKINRKTVCLCLVSGHGMQNCAFLESVFWVVAFGKKLAFLVASKSLLLKSCLCG
jgi:hypothetical protein